MYANPWFYVALLAIFFIGVTKSGFGSGVGLIIVPMTTLAMGYGAFPGRGAEAALGLLLPLLVVGDFISIWQHRHYFAKSKPTDVECESPGGGVATAVQTKPVYGTSRIMKLLLPGTFIGILIGSVVLWVFHQQQSLVASLMKIEIGCESMLMVGLHWWRISRGMQTRLMPEPSRGWLAGTFAGASSTLAHAAGPIIAMYLLPLRLERKLFVATCALYFFVLNAAKMPSYYYAGQFKHAELSFTMLFLPVLVAGALFGFWVNKRMSDKLFTNVIYFCTFVLGGYVMYEGIAALLKH